MSRQKDVRCANPILLSTPPTPLNMRSQESQLMSRWARRSLALLICLCSWGVAAQSHAQPSGLIVPLKGSAGVEANLEISLNKGLRRLFSSKLKLVDGAKTISALKAAGCQGAKCRSAAAKLAQSAEARFVVTPDVKNEFDIYNLKLSIADADFISQPMVEIESTCEFCDEAGLIAKLEEMIQNAQVAKVLSRPGKPKGPTSFVLSVVTSPKSAEIFLDGKRRGVSPIKIGELSAKTYDLEVKLKGYHSQKKRITPPKPLPSKPISESFTLKPKAPTSFPMIVKTKPKGASVILDGVTIKVKTPFKAKVKPGEHTIIIKLKGYKDYTQTFKTPAKSETIPITVALSKVAPAKPKKPAKPKTQPKSLVPNALTTPPPKPALLSGNVSGGMIAAGVIATGLGGWLLSLHGDIACNNGETRRTCPEIYDTKYSAGVLLGIGAATLGAGVISILINQTWPEPSAPAVKTSTQVKSGAKTSFMPSVVPTQDGAAASFSITF